MNICTSNDGNNFSCERVGIGTNLYPPQLSIVNDLILGLRLDHHNVSRLCTRADVDTGLFDVAVSCAARELDTGRTYRTRLIAVKKPRPVPDVDGLVVAAADDDNLLHLSRTQFLSCIVKLLCEVAVPQRTVETLISLLVPWLCLTRSRNRQPHPKIVLGAPRLG